MTTIRHGSNHRGSTGATDSVSRKGAEAEATLNNQERGKEWEYRVIAVNKGGEGAAGYAVGDFTGIGGQWRENLAALDALTGNATPWNPDAWYGSVYALTVSGSTLCVGGEFTSIGGQRRSGFAQFDRVPASSHGHWPLFK